MARSNKGQKRVWRTGRFWALSAWKPENRPLKAPTTSIAEISVRIEDGPDEGRNVQVYLSGPQLQWLLRSTMLVEALEAYEERERATVDTILGRTS